MTLIFMELTEFYMNTGNFIMFSLIAMNYGTQFTIVGELQESFAIILHKCNMHTYTIHCCQIKVHGNFGYTFDFFELSKFI